MLGDLSPSIAMMGCRGWRLHLLSEVAAELGLFLPVETQEETGPPVADAGLTASPQRVKIFL